LRRLSWKLALDAVLGERLGALVTPSHAEAVESIGYLQQQGEGKAFLVPEDARPTRPGERPARPDDEARSHGIRGRLLDLIEKKPGFDAVLDALLGSVLVVDTLEHAVAYYRTASEDGSLAAGRVAGDARWRGDRWPRHGGRRRAERPRRVGAGGPA
jgi:chromosome segregation ATPase